LPFTDGPPVLSCVNLLVPLSRLPGHRCQVVTYTFSEALSEDEKVCFQQSVHNYTLDGKSASFAISGMFFHDESKPIRDTNGGWTVGLPLLQNNTGNGLRRELANGHPGAGESLTELQAHLENMRFSITKPVPEVYVSVIFWRDEKAESSFGHGRRCARGDANFKKEAHDLHCYLHNGYERDVWERNLNWDEEVHHCIFSDAVRRN